MVQILPDFSREEARGAVVAGIDEAGRGPLAGPVVAAAVVFNGLPKISGINDSKKITPAVREKLFEVIINLSSYGVGIATVEEIDQINILQATMLAMRRAFDALPEKPKFALVDGNKAPKIPCQVECVIKGDSKSISIAAASILAKVTRDRMMLSLHEQYPHYGWNSNSGYGTQGHIEAMRIHGITSHHRRTFLPVREIIEKPQLAIAV